MSNLKIEDLKVGDHVEWAYDHAPNVWHSARVVRASKGTVAVETAGGGISTWSQLAINRSLVRRAVSQRAADSLQDICDASSRLDREVRELTQEAFRAKVLEADNERLAAQVAQLTKKLAYIEKRDEPAPADVGLLRACKLSVYAPGFSAVDAKKRALMLEVVYPKVRMDWEAWGIADVRTITIDFDSVSRLVGHLFAEEVKQERDAARKELAEARATIASIQKTLEGSKS